MPHILQNLSLFPRPRFLQWCFKVSYIGKGFIVKLPRWRSKFVPSKSFRVRDMVSCTAKDTKVSCSCLKYASISVSGIACRGSKDKARLISPRVWSALSASMPLLASKKAVLESGGAAARNVFVCVGEWPEESWVPVPSLNCCSWLGALAVVLRSSRLVDASIWSKP